jgi:hypothetical protein
MFAWQRCDVIETILSYYLCNSKIVIMAALSCYSVTMLSWWRYDILITFNIPLKFSPLTRFLFAKFPPNLRNIYCTVFFTNKNIVEKSAYRWHLFLALTCERMGTGHWVHDSGVRFVMHAMKFSRIRYIWAKCMPLNHHKITKKFSGLNILYLL